MRGGYCWPGTLKVHTRSDVTGIDKTSPSSSGLGSLTTQYQRIIIWLVHTAVYVDRSPAA